MKRTFKLAVTTGLLSIVVAGSALAANSESAFCGSVAILGGDSGCAGSKLDVSMGSLGFLAGGVGMRLVWNGTVDDLVKLSKKDTIICTLGGMGYAHLDCKDTTTGVDPVLWGNGGGAVAGLATGPATIIAKS